MRSGRWSTEFLGMSFHKWRLGFQQIGSSLSMKKKEKDGLVTMWNQSCPFYYIIPKKLLHDFCNDKKRNPTASRSSHYGCLLKSYSSGLFQTFPFRRLLKDHFFYLHTSPNLVQQHFSSFSPSFFSQNPTSSSLESPRKMRGNPTETPSSSNNHPPNLKLIDCFLRLFVIPLSVATIWLTVTNQQENSSFGLLKYSNLLGLKYMVCISAISTAYAFVAIVSTWIRFLVSRAWLFFLSDQIVAYLMVTSGAAVMEILYLAYNGDQKVTWSEACSSYGKFCYRMKLALIFHVLALGCFIVLAVISAYRCFCLFDPPLASKEVEEEETN